MARTPVLSPAAGREPGDPGHGAALLRAGWWVPALAAGTCAVALGAVEALARPRYHAVGLLRLGLEAPSSGSSSGRVLDPPPARARDQVVATGLRLLRTTAVGDATAAVVSGGAPGMRDGVELRAVEGTDLVEVHALGRDPREAAGRVNALMDAYVPRSDGVLGSRRARRQALAQVEAALAARRVQLCLREGQARSLGALVTAQRAALSASLVALEAALTRHRLLRAEALAERERLERVGDGGFLVDAELDREPTARQVALADLRARRAALQTAPDAADDELRAIDAHLQAEERVELEGRRVRAEAAWARADARERGHALATDAVASLLPGLEDEARRLEAQEREQDALGREREEVERDLARARADLDDLARAPGPEGAVIVDRAAPPAAPEPPVSPLGAAALLLASACAGVLALVARDRASARILCEADLRFAGAPPLLARIRRGGGGLDLLRANLGASVGAGRKVIVVSSSGARDPRADLSLALAGAMARAGERTLLVDADLSGAGLSSTLDAEAGLTDVLSGRRQLLDVLLPTRTPGLTVLSAGPPGAPDLLGRGRLGDLVEVALRHIDHVIVDTPPAGARVEATLAALQAQGVLHVVGLGSARAADVRAAVRQIEAGGGHDLGFVLVEPGALGP